MWNFIYWAVRQFWRNNTINWLLDGLQAAGVRGFWVVAAVAADNLYPLDTKACNLITRPRETFVLPLAMGLQPCAALPNSVHLNLILLPASLFTPHKLDDPDPPPRVLIIPHHCPKTFLLIKFIVLFSNWFYYATLVGLSITQWDAALKTNYIVLRTELSLIVEGKTRLWKPAHVILRKQRVWWRVLNWKQCRTLISTRNKSPVTIFSYIQDLWPR